MSTRTLVSGLLRHAWAPALLCALAPPVAAQETGSVSGTIVEARTRRPLVGAQVQIGATGRGGVTQANGRYVVTNVPAGQVEVRVLMIGYASASQTVAVRAGEASTADFELAERAIDMEEIVVTGAAGATERRKIGNTISSINVADLIRDAPISSFSELLKGRAVGVNVIPTSGQVGTGALIRIRGLVSVSQDNTPLVYIDGVRTDRTKESGPGLGGQGLSRLADLNPADIERVEVIKGAAATTLYGTEASAGVIQIFTRQGSQGAPLWTFNMEQGFERIPNVLRGDLYSEFQGPTGVRSRNANEIIETGHQQSYQLALGGGGEAIRYYVAGGFRRDEGSITPDRNIFRQVSARANITAVPTQKVSLNLNTSYVNSNLQIPEGDNGIYGLLTNIFLGQPYRATEDRPWGESFNSTIANRQIDNFQRVHHFVGGMTAEYQPSEDLRNALTIGVDMVGQEDTKLFPFGFLGSLYGQGRKDNRHRTYTDVSVDLRSVLSHQFSPSFTTESAVGAQGNFSSDYRVFGQGLDFPAPGVSTVGAGARTNSTETRVREVNAGLFAQETIGLWDKLFLTGGLRVDGNSAFGSEFRTQLYPKASAAYTISQESFWPTSFWPSMKLRLAWGTSGLAPAQFAADRTYLAVSALAGQPAVTPGNIGDANLAPEKSSEVEVGFDAGFFDDRIGLVFTYFRQQTTDALIPSQYAPSAGFLNAQLKNIGELRNNGVETSLRTLLLSTNDVTVDTDLQFTWADNKVTDMGGAAPIIRHVVNSLQVREGYPVSSFWAPQVTGWDADRRQHTRTDTAVYQGTDMPKFFGSFNLRVGLFRRLTLSGQADWATGHKHSNATRMFRIQYRTGDEYLATTERPTGTPTAASDSLVDYIVKGGIGSFIEDADFLKIRELAVTYSIPQSISARFGMRDASVRLAGRNLFTFTGYQGSDPETSWDGTEGFNTGAEFFTVPPARRISLAFRTTF